LHDVGIAGLQPIGETTVTHTFPEKLPLPPGGTNTGAAVGHGCNGMKTLGPGIATRADGLVSILYCDDNVSITGLFAGFSDACGFADAAVIRQNAEAIASANVVIFMIDTLLNWD
jgi:hypothetical protein